MGPLYHHAIFLVIKGQKLECYFKIILFWGFNSTVDQNCAKFYIFCCWCWCPPRKNIITHGSLFFSTNIPKTFLTTLHIIVMTKVKSLAIILCALWNFFFLFFFLYQKILCEILFWHVHHTIIISSFTITTFTAQ